jgi:DNA-binding GntR family transcriptional regulator
MKTSTAVRQMRSSEVAERLREQIVRGELQDGDQLQQDGLAEAFETSPQPVKKALQQLASEGLVKFVANRKAVVSALSPEEVDELFEIRSLLECEVLRLSIPNLTEADFKKAEAILAAFDKSLLHDGGAGTWGRLNAQFHSVLYSGANRPHFLSLIEMINNIGERYTRIQLYLTRLFERAKVEHRQLLDLCKKRDTTAACALLEAHILHAGSSLKEFLAAERQRGQEKTSPRGTRKMATHET